MMNTARRGRRSRLEAAAWLTLTLVACHVVACGGTVETRSSQDEHDGGTGAAAGSGGTSGSGGTAGVSGSGGTAGVGGTGATAGSGGVAGSGGASMCTMPTQADVQGPFFVTLSIVIAPNLPMLAVSSLDVDPATGSIAARLQPLDATTSTPVGAPMTSKLSPIASDGSFQMDFGTVTVDGEADPISGSDLETTLLLSGHVGSLCTPVDVFCGDIDGVASKPISGLDLKGSTFSFQRIADPGSLPPPLLTCD